MFVVQVDWRARPADDAAFAELLVRQSRNSLKLEPACQVFEVARDDQSPGRYTLYEVYDDAAGFDAHRKTPHYAAFAAAVEPMTLSKEVRILTRIAA